MTAKAIVERYFEGLKGNGDWDSLFSESVAFTSYTSPVRQIMGRAAFLKATQRFYTSIVSVEIRSFIAEGDRVCALTHYELRAAAGNTFTSEVAEIFVVANAAIISFAIYFDSAPFPK
jgi:ketosteroid isomerase-like protein